MATGNTRLVRYIAIAIFVSRGHVRSLQMCPTNPRHQLQTLALFYFVSHSKYDGVSIRPSDFSKEGWASQQPQEGAPTEQQPEVPVQPGLDTSVEEPIKGDAPTEETNQGNPNGAPKDHPEEFGSSSKALIEESGRQHPMAMTPSDPGWNDLMGTAPGPRMNATFVTLARNSDVWEIAKSIRHVEDRFNRRYNYDWVFLNDKPFDDTFKKVTSSLVSGTTYYGEIPEDHWSFPEWIDQEKAKKVREDMKARKIIYGDSVSYRHMCRFESGFFFRHPLMMNYEYYWRVEPSIELYCDIHYDPFRVMVEEGKKYSFVLSLYEYAETIETLWDSTKKFMKNHPEHIAPDNSMRFLSDDGGDTYNRCHFVRALRFPTTHFITNECSGPTLRSEAWIGCEAKPTLTSLNPSTTMAASSMSAGETRPSTPLQLACCSIKMRSSSSTTLRTSTRRLRIAPLESRRASTFVAIATPKRTLTGRATLVS